MRRLFLILLIAAPLSAETVRYQVRPVYSNIGFSIVKWGVLKEEGQFREFNGTLDYDPFTSAAGARRCHRAIGEPRHEK